jgi:hypothetical protein
MNILLCLKVNYLPKENSMILPGIKPDAEYPLQGMISLFKSFNQFFPPLIRQTN